MFLAVVIRRLTRLLPVCIVLSIAMGVQSARAQGPAQWKSEWPRTDLSRATVPLGQIRSVIGKDRISAIDKPRFAPVRSAA